MKLIFIVRVIVISFAISIMYLKTYLILYTILNLSLIWQVVWVDIMNNYIFLIVRNNLVYL